MAKRWAASSRNNWPGAFLILEGVSCETQNLHMVHWSSITLREPSLFTQMFLNLIARICAAGDKAISSLTAKEGCLNAQQFPFFFSSLPEG